MSESPAKLDNNLDDRATKKSTNISRRTFIKIGAVTAVAAGLGMWSRYAYAGVGGGGWGNNGGTASVGSHFGEDGGWAYSYDGCVWLSVSSNATVTRMSELLTEIEVSAYYANAGIWNPTWYTDFPDTHVETYISNGSAWVASAYQFCDTTYDSWGYHGPYLTHAHTVRRESGDWWSYAGVHAWCNAADNANGINAWAQGQQLIPHHNLNDDKSWRNKIFTMTPRCSPNLRLDVAAGQTGNGSNIFFWEPLDTTNQCWIACGGPYGLTTIEPAHVDTNMCVDSGDTAPWSQGTSVHLWSYVGGTNQALWLHNKGDGYHYPVFHHSGFAMSCSGAGSANGTNAIHHNAFMNNGGASDLACNYKLEEAVFRERAEGAMTVSGTPKPGETLTLANPNEKCIPYNYPGTNGMLYKYTWYRGATKGAKTTVVQAESETSSYTVTAADEGKYLTAVVSAYSRFWGIKYKGEVQLPSILVPDPSVTVSYIVDGGMDACFSEKIRKGSAYNVNTAANEAAAKVGCSGLDGWYTDKLYTKKFENGTVVNEDLALYSRNSLNVEYGYTRQTKDLLSAHQFYKDKAFNAPYDTLALEGIPPKASYWYGDTLNLPAFAYGSLYCKTNLIGKEILAIPFEGYWLNDDQSGVPKGANTKIALKGSIKIHVGFGLVTGDGIKNINNG